jgi:SAM-dependent methyltransferase
MEPVDRPTTWHHGLVARWWAEVNVAEPDELAYYGAAIARYGEPALDLGCGAGRLLVPFLLRGLDVDGVDISPDMLARAREAAAASGLDIGGRVVTQAFHELNPPRRYRTVYCCDSFAIGGSRQLDAVALRRVFEHMEPGGAFVFSYDLPQVDDPGAVGEPGASYPESWPAEGRRARLADGDELELMTRTSALDRALGRETLEFRCRLRRAGEVVAEEAGTLLFSLYALEELRAMLETAGFVGIEVEGRYTGVPAGPADATVVILARRS